MMNATERLKKSEIALQAATTDLDGNQLRLIVTDLLDFFESLCIENANLEMRRESLEALLETDAVTSQKSGESKSGSLQRFGCNPQQFFSGLGGVTLGSLLETMSSKLDLSTAVVEPVQLAADIRSTKEISFFLRAAVECYGLIAKLPLDDPVFVMELATVLDMDRRGRQRILSPTEVNHESGS
jgi:hypothetical protein